MYIKSRTTSNTYQCVTTVETSWQPEKGNKAFFFAIIAALFCDVVTK